VKRPRCTAQIGPTGIHDRYHFGLSGLLRFCCISVPFLGGCSTPGWLCLAPPGPSSATIIADPDANNTSAIAVDVLFISDTLAAQQISVLTATDYFARRTQLQRDFPGGLLIRSRELAPGQIARDVPLNPNCNRVRTLLFARYLTPGDHRQSVANVSRILVSLGRDDFTVSR
jgi:type VI secretion system protein